MAWHAACPPVQGTNLVDVLAVAAEKQLKAAGVRRHAPLLPRLPLPLAHPQHPEQRVHRALEELRRYLLAVFRFLRKRSAQETGYVGRSGSRIHAKTAAQGGEGRGLRGLAWTWDRGCMTVPLLGPSWNKSNTRTHARTHLEDLAENLGVHLAVRFPCEVILEYAGNVRQKPLRDRSQLPRLLICRVGNIVDSQGGCGGSGLNRVKPRSNGMSQQTTNSREIARARTYGLDQQRDSATKDRASTEVAVEPAPASAPAHQHQQVAVRFYALRLRLSSVQGAWRQVPQSLIGRRRSGSPRPDGPLTTNSKSPRRGCLP